MKKTALILTAIVSAASISAGEIYWDDKIQRQTATAASQRVASTPALESTNSIQPELVAVNLTKNLPRPAAEVIMNAEKEESQLNSSCLDPIHQMGKRIHGQIRFGES
ncbi:hypothetical protein AS29_008450 [Bacillus sp. SJS]|nr:hypothetical protein AS29_008450 [Bacillus sp. SJS]